MNQRVLSAVMFTDIVGYSAIANRDEEEALRIVEINRSHQKPIIEKYGIYLKEMGDGVLARFSSAYDSILCAKEIQRDCPPELVDKIRIGLHLGDVSESNDDIFGDGVNVASRLESKAEPGKIYISDSVYNAIKGRGDITTKYVGTFKLKHIKDPVRTYRVLNEGERKSTGVIPTIVRKNGLRILVALLIAYVLVEFVVYWVARNNLDKGLIDIVILGVFFVFIGYQIVIWIKGSRMKVILAHVLNILIAFTIMGFYVLNPLEINPSALRLIEYDYNKAHESTDPEKGLVVLPIYNDIGEEQDYLTAGIQDGIINEIGKLGSIRIISRTSALPYAKAEKSLTTIANELHVDMVVEGSLIRIDSTIQLNVKLINPFLNEKVLWSDSYDVTISEIQLLFKEVTRNVAMKINQVLLPSEESLLSKSSRVNSVAYQSALMGKYFLGYMNKDGFDKAEKYFKKALEVDSTFAPAYSGLAVILGSRKQMGFVSPREVDAKIRSYLEDALLLDHEDAEVWSGKAALMVWTDYDFEGGEKAFLRSIELNPNFSMARAGYAHLLMILNRWDEAWEQMNYALALDPLNPLVIAFSGAMYSFEGKFLSATKKFEEITALVPDHAMANFYLLQKYSRTFQYNKAAIELDRFVGDYLPNHKKLIEEWYAKEGLKTTNRLTAEALAEQYKIQFVPASKIAILYEAIGDTEARLHWIEEMYNQKSPGLPYLAIRNGDPIQDNPRYIGVMKKAGFW